jgi:hypothetical protein
MTQLSCSGLGLFPLDTAYSLKILSIAAGQIRPLWEELQRRSIHVLLSPYGGARVIPGLAGNAVFVDEMRFAVSLAQANQAV